MSLLEGIKMFYTSRSAIETYQRCPRKRFYQYHWNGIGIVPIAKSIPLTTGTCVHAGVEYLLKRMMNYYVNPNDKENWETEIDAAVTVAQQEYIRIVGDSGFAGPGVQRSHQQEYTYQEQVALTEALVRVWGLVEGLQIWERFQITAVERELTTRLLDSPEVVLQARVDAELKDRVDGSYFNYSLKTTKQWDERSERSYKHDLQGVIETYVVEQQEREVNYNIQKTLEAFSELENSVRKKDFILIISFLEKQRQEKKRLMGVKFCYLVKGAWGPTEKGNPDCVYHTQNNLLRGWRFIGPSSIEYKISQWYPNPENKSGWGRLGKGWEEFDVWEDKNWGVKKWIHFIKENDLEVLKKYCVTPVEYFRDEDEINEAIKEVTHQEHGIIHRLVNELDRAIEFFPKYRQSCHYPLDCEYLPLCWPTTGINASDPIGSGLYQIRVPHHEKEREWVKSLNQ